MTDRYTDAVLNRAQRLQQTEHAALALMHEDRIDALRAAIAAALAALMAFYPSVSAAVAML